MSVRHDRLKEKEDDHQTLNITELYMPVSCFVIYNLLEFRRSIFALVQVAHQVLLLCERIWNKT